MLREFCAKSGVIVRGYFTADSDEPVMVIVSVSTVCIWFVSILVVWFSCCLGVYWFKALGVLGVFDFLPRFLEGLVLAEFHAGVIDLFVGHMLHLFEWVDGQDK